MPPLSTAQSLSISVAPAGTSRGAPLAPSGAADTWPVRRQLAFITIAWMFGSIWFNVTTGAPMTAFAKGLGASYFQFGLLAAMPYIAALFSLPGSLLVERTGDRKRIFLNTHCIQRSLSLVIAIAPLVMFSWYGQAATGHAITLVLSLCFLMHASGATGGPAWVSWMADVVPQRVRGSYFARRRQWGIVTAIPAAIAIGWGLQSFAAGSGASSPLAGVPPIVFWCAALIAVTAFFGLADILLFAPLPHTSHEPKPTAGLLRSMTVPLKDRPFMTLSTFVGAINFTVGFTNQFATIYVIDRLGVGHVQVQMMLLVAPMLLQLAILPAWGAAVDRMGRKPLLIIAAMGMVPMSFGWIAMGKGGTEMAWLGYILFAGGAALWTGIEVANFNCVIDASGRDDKKGGSAYHAVNTLMINFAGCCGGVVAGLIAGSLSTWTWQPIAGLRPVDFYDALFALSGTVRVAALIVLAPLMIEPTAKSVSQTARFILTFSTAGLASQFSRLSEWWKGEPELDGVLATLSGPQDPVEVRSAA